MKIYSSAGNPVFAAKDAFPALNEWLDGNGIHRIFIITDENCYLHCYPLLFSAISKRYNLIPVVMAAGEKSKTLSTCEYIWQKLGEAKADKKDIIINLGGGVITDTGAFCASVYKRGIRFINMPASLMGMADAAIGGKCGIDFMDIKNHIGLVSFPAAIFIHFNFLETLPPLHMRNGYAEIFKSAFITSRDFSDSLPLHFTMDFSSDILLRALEVKLDIVGKDPYEMGIRKALNFGHTCGHAIESCLLKNSNQVVFHGDAVVAGMIMELLLSVEYTGMNKNTAWDCIRKLKSFFPVPGFLNISADEFTGYIFQDKKNESGQIRPCLLKDIGDPVWDVNLPEDAFRHVLMQFNSLREYAE